MSQSHKFSFLVILGLVFLAPLFFAPGLLYIGSAKSVLLTVGVVVAALVFMYECWRDGVVVIPKTHLLTAVALLPVVYLLSALLATPSSLSLLGYNFELGTFGFILISSVTFYLVASVVTDTTQFLKVLLAFFSSLSILTLFSLVKIFTGGDWSIMGNFAGVTGNPVGVWTDLAIVFGLLSVISALAIGMLPTRGWLRVGLYTVFLLSLVLLVVLGFSTAFALTLVASILLFLYFSRLENGLHTQDDGEDAGRNFLSKNTFLPMVLVVVSLVFLINPTISKDKGVLTNVISSAFNVESTDVRPTLSATLNVSKAVLSQDSLLGSGPNTFSQDWLIFKPANVNSTPFWAVSFPFGAGFIPTQVATTGVLGSALWAVFFVLLAVTCTKLLGRIPQSRGDRFVIVSGVFITVFLWVGSILYTPSAVVLWLAFVFAGFVLASSRDMGITSVRIVSLSDIPQAKFVSASLIIVLTVGFLYVGWIGLEKTVASYHFKKATDLASTDGASILDVESHIERAIELSPVDIHYVALARLNFTKAQSVANSTDGTPEENGVKFQEALGKSIQASRMAVNANPASYENWVSLGMVYSSIVPEPLKVEGAYENAQFAFSEAYKRNPTNPELPLLLAQLEINKGNMDNARSYIRNSIALKEDYADAYLALAKLEISEKNIPAAIASTEALAVLAPNNAGIRFELGVLKYSNNDFEGAAESFNEALRISPDYANAKYYLGLTLVKLDRALEAQTIFEELLLANPDNAELKSALESLSKSKK